MKVTRRKLAVMLSTSAAALAQAPAPQPATQDEELRAARERLRTNIAALAGQQVPMSVEPAFQFKP